MTNSTFTNNTSAGGNAGAISNNGAVTLKNTLMSGVNNCSGGISDGGYNLDSGTSCHFSATGSQSNVANAKLGPLADYGGPTQTIALLSGSPALDAIPVAKCTDLSNPPVAVTTDQRGVARPQNSGCDIGAFEVIAPPSAPGTLTLSVVSSTRIDLTWGDATGESGYYVQRNTIGTNGPWSLIATLPANTTAYSDTRVGPSTTYYFQVVAFNSSGSTPSNTPNATTGVADYIVSINTDQGMAVDKNTQFTLSYALNHATTGKSIGFTVQSVTVSGQLQTVPTGVTIFGGKCGDQPINIKAAGNYPTNPVTNGLVLGAGNILVNIKVSGFPGIQIVAGPGGEDNVQCVTASKI